MAPQLMALKDFITKNMCTNDELVGYLVDDIYLLNSMEKSVQDIIYEFGRRGIQCNLLSTSTSPGSQTADSGLFGLFVLSPTRRHSIFISIL